MVDVNKKTLEIFKMVAKSKKKKVPFSLRSLLECQAVSQSSSFGFCESERAESHWDRTECDIFFKKFKGNLKKNP